MAPFFVRHVAIAAAISRRNCVRRLGVRHHAGRRDVDRLGVRRLGVGHQGHGYRRDDFHLVRHRDGRPQDADHPDVRAGAGRGACRRRD
jgi:hypothetical protein